MIGGLRRQQLLRYSGRVDRLVRAKSGAGPNAEQRRAYQVSMLKESLVSFNKDMLR